MLYGMGGLGKSTLASRLLERMPQHQRVVWFGAIDDIELNKINSKLRLPSPDHIVALDQILGHEQLDLDTKFRLLLDEGGPLADIPCLFVFDNFEERNLVLDGERYTWAPKDPERASAQEIVGGLLRAIRATGSPSRVIITCRYQFPEPPGTRLHFEPLRTLDENELAKKLRWLDRLAPDSTTAEDVRDRAIELAAGNPRLLEWLNRVIDSTDVETQDVFEAIEGKAAEFREDILARTLLGAIPQATVDLLAKVNVVELPIPAAAVEAIHGQSDIDQHIQRSTRLGLLETGPDPEDRTATLYYVSNVLRPLLDDRLDEPAKREACAAAARSLYVLWADGSLPEATTEDSDQ